MLDENFGKSSTRISILLFPDAQTKALGIYFKHIIIQVIKMTLEKMLKIQAITYRMGVLVCV